jgi:hypothetical protein
MKFLIIYRNSNCNCQQFLETIAENWDEVYNFAKEQQPNNFHLRKITSCQETIRRESLWRWN